MDRRSRSGRGGEEKNSQPPPGIEPKTPIVVGVPKINNSYQGIFIQFKTTDQWYKYFSLAFTLTEITNGSREAGIRHFVLRQIINILQTLYKILFISQQM